MIEQEITSYQPSDQEDLVQFFRTVFGVMGFGFDLNAKDKDLGNIPREYESNGGLFLLARCQGQLIGTVALRQIEQDICELKRFYVRPEHQGHGVGTSLLRKALDQAKAGGSSRIRLDTTSKSPSAIALFRQYGFVEIERYNDNPLAEIFMELDLQHQ